MIFSSFSLSKLNKKNNSKKGWYQKKSCKTNVYQPRERNGTFILGKVTLQCRYAAMLCHRPSPLSQKDRFCAKQLLPREAPFADYCVSFFFLPFLYFLLDHREYFIKKKKTSSLEEKI